MNKMKCNYKLNALAKIFLVFATVQIFFPLPNPSAQERLVERAPTKFFENGKAVFLEIIIMRPAGAGPFPTVLFNHGSTGKGDDPSLFKKTWTNDVISKFFNERGWMVVFPQRRGRGNSDGVYDEGFERDRSRYTCIPQLSLPGLERALDDLDAAVDFLKARSDVDSKRIIVGGQSRGGILSIVYAGTRPDHFIGAVNFVGGWMTDRCRESEAINTASFKRGANFKKPTIWLYGEKDSYYSMEHSRKNFDAFIKAGGKGTFNSYSLGASKNGHQLINSPDLWRAKLSDFIENLQ